MFGGYGGVGFWYYYGYLIIFIEFIYDDVLDVLVGILWVFLIDVQQEICEIYVLIVIVEIQYGNWFLSYILGVGEQKWKEKQERFK